MTQRFGVGHRKLAFFTLAFTCCMQHGLSKLKKIVFERAHRTSAHDAMQQANQLHCTTASTNNARDSDGSMTLKSKIVWWVLPVLLLLLLEHVLLTFAYMKSVRIDEIPFGLSEADRSKERKTSGQSGIHAISQLEQRRSFFHLFHVPYIVCFFAAKGKWPFIPPFMQNRVDMASKSFFSQNDSFIKQFCNKWIAIKECFRPIFTPTTATSEVEALAAVRATTCTCANLVATESSVPVVYFDKDHIGNVSKETILNTIEFLESFLPPPTKKTKRKNRVRSRLDEMDIE